ncbi:MAG: T9SS type A sorting domain-containing protein [Bacteroidetes bacterium]|nr:T9SS type A sorting domain-containing protein [Bacteroidota bacterium]
MIELPEDALKKLGFKVTENSITFNISFGKSSMDIGISNKGNFMELFEHDSISATKIKLTYLSNIYGEKNIKWENSKNSGKNSNVVFLEKIQYLVPVFIKMSDYPNILYQDQIFWFEPSNDLFEALPGTIGDQLKNEYNFITAKSTEENKSYKTDCTYFESCKSTLLVKDIRVFPNPANQVTTFEFKLDQQVNGSISLLSISGAQKKQLTGNTTFNEGLNSLELDVSDISPGIYLILLKTNKGFSSQRLIISR